MKVLLFASSYIHASVTGGKGEKMSEDTLCERSSNDKNVS